MSQPLIEFDHATVLRGDAAVLDQFSLRIDTGENVAILGPNGCGKSTLIKTIVRECYPLHVEGRAPVRLFGQAVWKLFELRALLGIVSNDLMTQCTRDVTGRELVLSGLFGSIGIHPHQLPLLTPEMEERAMALMEFLEVPHLRNRWLDELSSGEARRLLIARALIHGPKALILDEPTNSLDLNATRALKESMRKLAQSGTSIILVTHHVSDIIPEIDRVILLRKGKVFRDGSKYDVLDEQALAALFGGPVELFQRDGYFHAV